MHDYSQLEKWENAAQGETTTAEIYKRPWKLKAFNPQTSGTENTRLHYMQYTIAYRSKVSGGLRINITILPAKMIKTESAVRNVNTT